MDMSEANGHNGNGNGNGHPPINADVYPRIGKLETGMARLESNVQVIHEQVSKVNASIDKIADSLGKSREANYPFMWQLLIGSVAITATLGGVFIAPLRAADAYHEKDIERIRTVEMADLRREMKEMQAAILSYQRADHDELIRLQEREKMRGAK